MALNQSILLVKTKFSLSQVAGFLDGKTDD